MYGKVHSAVKYEHKLFTSLYWNTHSTKNIMLHIIIIDAVIIIGVKVYVHYNYYY